MMRSHVTVGPSQGYGYGLSVLPDYRGGPLIEHSGGRRSISAHVAFVPSRGLAVAVLANLADAPVRAIAHGLLNTLDGVAPEVPPIVYPDYACPPERLAAYAALLAIPTMIAGIYGMNFEHMPELKWRYGYELSLFVMGAIDVLLYFLFKRNKWL